MKTGGMTKVAQTSRGEKVLAQRLRHIDEWMLTLREMVRQGEMIEDAPHVMAAPSGIMA